MCHLRSQTFLGGSLSLFSPSPQIRPILGDGGHLWLSERRDNSHHWPIVSKTVMRDNKGSQLFGMLKIMKLIHFADFPEYLQLNQSLLLKAALFRVELHINLRFSLDSRDKSESGHLLSK